MKTRYAAELTLGERGQVVIPKATRDRLGIAPKTKLLMVEADGELLLTPKPDLRSMDAAYKKLRGRGKGNLEKIGFKSVDDFLTATRGR